MMSDEPDEDLSEDGDDIVLDVVTTLDSNPTFGAKPFCDDWPREGLALTKQQKPALSLPTNHIASKRPEEVRAEYT